MGKLKNFLLYAGLTKTEYSNLKEEIVRENFYYLGIYTTICSLLFGLLVISSIVVDSFADINLYIYSSLFVIMIFLAVLSNPHLKLIDAKRSPQLAMLLIYVYILSLYIFSFQISLIHLEHQAVTVIVVILVIPLLFIDRPLIMSCFTIFVTFSFCILAYLLKAPSVAEIDIWNCISYGFVSIFADMFVIQVRAKALNQSQRITYLHKYDLLTKTLNRNSYEQRMLLLPTQFENNLICVFTDINGLHELNNKEGHAAGDIMLQTTATELKNVFGEENVYRIGGDEFVAFLVDKDPRTIKAQTDIVQIALENQGYYSAIGQSVLNKSDDTINIDKLVREAENDMYISKQEYYKKHGDTRDGKR